jgi:acyl-ACP thioesterase
LDDDVAMTVKEEMKAGDGKTFKDALNDLVRRARYVSTNGAEKPKPFKVRSFNMGVYEHLNYDKINELIEEIEGPLHR